MPGLLRAVAAERPGHPAVVDGETTLTFAELADHVMAAARGFIGLGVEPGDRVAIWAPNTWEWVLALLGLQSAGAVLVPLNTRYKGVEAAHILRASQAEVLCTVQGFLGNDFVTMLSDADLPDLRTTVVLRGEIPDGTLSFDGLIAAGGGVAPAEVDRRVAALTPETLSDLLFTSGTTGLPKGVMCTHGQTLRAFADWARTVGLGPDDRYLVVNPFFHAFGYKAGIVAAFSVGATVVPEAIFDTERVMEAVESHKITMLPGPPALYQTMLNHPALDMTKLSSLRLAVTGAAVVPVALVEAMRDTLGFDTVITGYGLTEACGIATMCRHDDDPQTIASFSGRAVPGVEVEVHDADGVVQPAMTPGEVVVRGYNVMQGYADDPGQTAEAIDEHGWLHTGDIGIMDERGYLRITDRLKDMFIVGGFNAYPAEIESLLAAHPDLAQVAVVGMPDDRLGEVGVAFVVAAHGATPDPDSIMTWARDQMANFKVPRQIVVVDSLPLNASGKVLKTDLRARLAP